MSTAAAIVVAVAAVLTLLGAAARGVWKGATQTQKLVSATEKLSGDMTANTKATERLSGDMKEFSSTTAATLAEHGERIARLESR